MPAVLDNGLWCSRCGDAPKAPNHSYCGSCRNAYQNEYRRRRYREEPEYRRKALDAQRHTRYGISEERYNELLAKQGGVCAICLLQPEGKDLGVDHDHATGRIRGLLCVGCNGAIGMLREDPEIIERAAHYLAIYDN